MNHAAQQASPTDGRPVPWKAIGALAPFALAAAFPIGALIWALLSAAYRLIELIWETGAQAAGALWTHFEDAAGFSLSLSSGIPDAAHSAAHVGDFPFFPLLICTLGGLLVGLWTKRFDAAPKPLDSVMADVRKKGGYSVGRIVPSSVAFLLPIAFGGSVGPEAGLIGLIAAGCTWTGGKIRAASRRLCGSDGLSRAQKRFVYAFGIAGGVLGAAAVTALGGGMVLPRFGAAAITPQAFVWFVPLAAAGYALALVYTGAGKLGRFLARRLSGKGALAPVLCGAALGCAATFLPYVLFPGSAQAAELAVVWGDMAPAALVATAFVKAAFVALCLSMGWSGGPFFPLIFCGVSLGLGIAAATGADPMLAAAVVPATLVAAFCRKPAVSVLTMLLIAAPASLPWIIVAALIGALAPIPGLPAWKPKGRKRIESAI